MAATGTLHSAPIGCEARVLALQSTGNKLAKTARCRIFQITREPVANILATHDENRIHKIMQVIKWIVYSLLLINFGYYLVEDWTRAMHTLRDGGTFLEWTNEFATSIDEVAWFVLLAMFELETYSLSDETFDGWAGHVVRGARICCYVMLAHTVFASANSALEYRTEVPVEGVSDLCSLADDDVSFVRNLKYTYIDTVTCGEISDAEEFFWVTGDPVVSDAAGLALEHRLAWVELAEACAWLLVLVAIEMVVRLQSNGITGGALFVTANTLRIVFYSVILSAGAYWAWLGHWVYLWDEIVWIGGFAIIDMNVAEWRDELLQEQEIAAQPA
jgi:hypothetical protein